MKKIILCALILFAAMSCSKFDDSAIWKSLKEHEERISKLETLCNQLNTNILSLQTIVAALQNNDYITNVAPINSNGVEIGFTITFAKRGSITIYHGHDGKDGENGKDGSSPIIGVRQDADGTYCWTLNGEWILDSRGNKIPTSGKDGIDGTNAVTPKLKIVDDYWSVSYDNGATWEKLGKATGEKGADGSNITITQDEDNCYITLPDGTIITLEKSNYGYSADIIKFEDPYVKDICVRQWDTDKDGELSYLEASSVETVEGYFTHTEYASYYDNTFKRTYYTLIKAGNPSIRSFAELRYFTSIKKLEMKGFASDINLIKIELPDNLEEICDGFDSNVLRYEWNAGGKVGLSSYHMGIFSRTGLTEISLPSTVKKIGKYAFFACPYLSDVYCYSITPPSLGDSVFGASLKNIFVPSESVDLYKSALGWKEYSDIIKAM